MGSDFFHREWTDGEKWLMGIIAALLIAAIVGAVTQLAHTLAVLARDDGPRQVRGGGFAVGADGQKRNIAYDDYVDRTFSEAIRDAERDLDVVVDYRTCPASLAETIVREGTTSGESVSEYLMNLQTRLQDTSIRYRVEQETRTRYLLVCDQ